MFRITLLMLLVLSGCQRAYHCEIESKTIHEFKNSSNPCEINQNEDIIITEEMIKICCNGDSCSFTSPTSVVTSDENKFIECMRED